jgi:hypothetical protein
MQPSGSFTPIIYKRLPPAQLWLNCKTWSPAAISASSASSETLLAVTVP